MQEDTKACNSSDAQSVAEINEMVARHRRAMHQRWQRRQHKRWKARSRMPKHGRHLLQRRRRRRNEHIRGG